MIIQNELSVFNMQSYGQIPDISILNSSSVCLLFVVCMSRFFTMTTNPYISAKNKDNDTKHSGYDPWGLRRSSMLSSMILSSKSPVRNSQYPPSTPLLDPPPSWPSSNWDINTKFSGYLPCCEKTSFMISGMTLSSIFPVRIPQRPPSTPLLDPPFLTHL